MDESMVEGCQAMETLDFRDIVWHRPVLNSLDLGWISLLPFGGDDIAQKGQAICYKIVLLRIGK